MIRAVIRSGFIRVAAVAVALSTLSFAAGIAGDLSMVEPARSGERVVLRIPPELPTDTIRAAPLPPSVTPAVAASTMPRRPRQLRTESMAFAATAVTEEKPVEAVQPADKPRTLMVSHEAKPDPDRAPKTESA